MIDIKPIDKLESISQLKAQYFALSSAPLDGMWHFGFVPMASHFGFYEQDNLVGFCCINDENYLLQFYLAPEAETDAKALFRFIAQQQSQVIKQVKGAYVSTAEPHYLSLCLDNSTQFAVNALMYQQLVPVNNNVTTLTLALAKPEQLQQFVEFAATNIGAPEQWVSGYYGNLISRKELFGYWQNGELLATGECRLFDEYQTEYADLGMIVAQSHRGKGLATQVLSSLINLANDRGLTPICSTETGNIGAQKAIERAGLMPQNRIVQIAFEAK
ncbi:GNAT family N-acetyltransferase [Shewanella japonica]|uniref:GNAT family N-acetyltransferase n=1 Tax=Shewanella japonica TaxID=93973 RepID=UPI00249561D1|nr:GNAT family N-acetyltransferase [Shewanella japonica]